MRNLIASFVLLGFVVLLSDLFSTYSSLLAHQREGEEHQLRRNPLLAPLSKQQQNDAEPGLVERVQMLDQKVRQIKANLPKGHFMETDEKGVAATKSLQDATRALLSARYGNREPYRVKIGLKFKPSNPTTATMGVDDSFVIELASSTLQPHSIFTFLELSRHWSEKKGAFHRRAEHVLQVLVEGRPVPHLAFQEYSPQYPHTRGTVGYAGRPSGPEWYVSILDNSADHGPGTQQKENPYEADSCFGRVVEGFDSVVMQRINKMPGTEFLEEPNHVLIDYMTILVPKGGDGEGYEEWHPSSPVTEFKK